MSNLKEKKISWEDEEDEMCPVVFSKKCSKWKTGNFEWQTRNKYFKNKVHPRKLVK